MNIRVPNGTISTGINFRQSGSHRILQKSMPKNLHQKLTETTPWSHQVSGNFATRGKRGLEQKPNEDYAVVDNKELIYIVCDGVTRFPVKGSYPRPSPAAK